MAGRGRIFNQPEGMNFKTRMVWIRITGGNKFASRGYLKLSIIALHRGNGKTVTKFYQYWHQTKHALFWHPASARDTVEHCTLAFRLAWGGFKEARED
jgi:hypothetical protein